MPMPQPVAPMPTEDQPQYDEQGNPIDPNMVDPNAPPQAPVDPNAVPPSGDPNAQGDPEQEGEEDAPPPTPYYYNDGEDEPDGDEDYPDPTGQGVRKAMDNMEPLATDTGILTQIIGAEVRKAMAASQVPFTAKMNELIAANGALTTEVTTLKAQVAEYADVIKSLGTTPAEDDVTKALDADTVPPAAPDAPEASTTDVQKALDEGKTNVDPETVADADGNAGLITKAQRLVKEARNLRDSVNKSWGDGARENLVQALLVVQKGNITSDTVKALETAISAAK